MASSQMIALLGLLAVAGYQNRDKLAQVLGNLSGAATSPGLPTDSNAHPNGPAAGDPLGGIFDSLGRVFGPGKISSGISDGLGDLVDQFTRTGQGDTARSWVEIGPNREISGRELEVALGEDSIDALKRQTGLSREELLERLHAVLPMAVDTLTPEGKLPTPDEAHRKARGFGEARG